MTTTQILDKILPYTKQELRCARIRPEKTRARYKLMTQIDELRAHYSMEEILNILNDNRERHVA